MLTLKTFDIDKIHTIDRTSTLKPMKNKEKLIYFFFIIIFKSMKNTKTIILILQRQTWMKSNMVRGRRSSKIAISLENLLRIPPVI